MPAPRSTRAWRAEFRRKLGLVADEEDEKLAESDTELIHGFLNLLYEGEADFTNGFRALTAPQPKAVRDQFTKPSAELSGAYDDWCEAWAKRLQEQGDDREAVAARLKTINPKFIPRNHRVEEAIEAGQAGDFSVFETVPGSLHPSLRRPLRPRRPHAAS